MIFTIKKYTSNTSTIGRTRTNQGSQYRESRISNPQPQALPQPAKIKPASQPQALSQPLITGVSISNFNNPTSIQRFPPLPHSHQLIKGSPHPRRCYAVERRISSSMWRSRRCGWPWACLSCSNFGGIQFPNIRSTLSFLTFLLVVCFVWLFLLFLYRWFLGFIVLNENWILGIYCFGLLQFWLGVVFLLFTGFYIYH